MAELYLVRHAQASFGSDNYDQLSELGYRQATWLGEYFSDREIQFDGLITGTQTRHRQTLESIVPDARGREQVRSHAGLNEYDFGVLLAAYAKHNSDDKLLREAQKDPSNKDNYFRVLRQALSHWAGGQLPEEDLEESWSDFEARVCDARTWVQSISESGKRYLVISSGGAISMFIGSVLGLSPEKVFDLNFQIKNTAVNQFFFNAKKISLSGFNNVAHLDINKRREFVTYG